MNRLTAEQARENAIKHQLNIDAALELINNSTNGGHCETVFTSGNLSYEAQKELMNLGYSISIVKDQLGYSFFKVSW